LASRTRPHHRRPLNRARSRGGNRGQ
jgi:hypothetical protein